MQKSCEKTAIFKKCLALSQKRYKIATVERQYELV